MIFCSKLHSDFYGFKMRHKTITNKASLTDTRMHTHNYIEIVYIANGSGTHEVGGTVYNVSEGDAVIVNIGETHAISSDSVMEMYYVCFFPSSVSGAIESSRDFYDILDLTDFSDAKKCFTKKSSVVSLGQRRGELIRSLMSEMYREYEKPGADAHIFFKSSVKIILNMLFRKMTDKKVRFVKNEMTRASVTAYVGKHCTSKLTLDEIAEWFNCNPSYFSRRFKELTGVTFAKYMRDERIKQAAKLLEETDNSIEEVCRLVGYSDRTAFYKEFGKRYGMRPAEYKKGKKK